MAARPTDTPSNPDAQAPVSRRSFLRVSALGAGAAAALPTLGCASAAAAAPSPDVIKAPATDDHEPLNNWVEPAEWRVGDHDEVPLQLAVYEIAAPSWLSKNNGPRTLFTYNGTLPGPTVRMRGDDALRVTLVNLLSGNDNNWAYINNSRFAKETTPAGLGGTVTFQPNDPVPDVADWKLSGSLMYGPHMQHTTNLHTHGLHVSPGTNPDGTHSDNVMLRIIPASDYKNRMGHEPPIPLNDHEVVGMANYEFRIGASSGAPTHPPGTHWYHPHPHGATYDQVVTGMAGFLIVEGDVDDTLNEVMAAEPAYNYRERVMMLQRIFDTAKAPIQDGEQAGSNVLQKNQRSVETVNGQEAGTLGFTMETGAIERWRILNGSVDGQGYVRIVIAPSEFGSSPPPTQNSGEPDEAYNKRFDAWAAQYALPFWHMAFDGITLVQQNEDGSCQYTARTETALQLAPANRSDLLVQAPQNPGIYTVWAVGVNHRAGSTAPASMNIATLTITERADPSTTPPAVEDGVFADILADIPVPDYLKPITDADLQGNGGTYRTRHVAYSGWGNSGYDHYIPVPDGVQIVPGDDGRNSMVISRTKYDPAKPVQLMGMGAAEEWVVDNYSAGKPIQPGGGAVDHPFHMHQNPFWVMAVLVPTWPSDAGDDNLDVEPTWENVLDHPRWQDVVPLPDNGGRVIFRARFPNYAGFYVNHCHILQHEDWGMMQAVEVMPDPADANNDWNDTVYSSANPHGGYPTPTLRTMVDYCQVINDLDGTVSTGGRVVNATPIAFAKNPPAK